MYKSGGTAAGYATDGNDSVEMCDGTNALQVNGISQFGDGGTTNYVEVEADGDMIFHGGAGLCYGSLYAHDASITVDLEQGNYVKITGLTAGLMHNVSENSDAFNVGSVGVYKVDWSISGDAEGANKDIECEIFVNGVGQADGSARAHWITAGNEQSMSGTALLDITSTGHDIDLRLKNATDNTNIDLCHVNFNIVQIGGTQT